MKLREVIRAISGFKYEVYEYDVFPGTGFKKHMLYLSTDETNIRCLQHDMHHEQMVGQDWYIIEKAQFDSILSDSKKRVITRKSTGSQTSKIVPARTLMSRISISLHIKDRALERFGVAQADVHAFIKSTLGEDHRIVQGAQFYNTNRLRNHLPSDLYICNLETNAILVGCLDGGNFNLITIYKARESVWFQNWFQDNMEKWDGLPTLDQFFAGSK